jgi:hypothetical protein
LNEPICSWEQKKRFHAMVRDIARDIPVWCEMRMDEEDWKRLLLAGAYGQKVIPNPIGDGFLVMNKARVRDMEKPNMTDLITQMMVFGNERGVQWTDPEWLALLAEQRKAA